VNFLYFFTVISLYLSILGFTWGFYGNPLAWLAEWIDFQQFLSKSASNDFRDIFSYPVLGASYLYWVAQAAILSNSLTTSYIPFVKSSFRFYLLYLWLFNVFFEIIIVILSMRLVSRYFGRIYASNIMFIFILLPLVFWLTISRWDMLPVALTVCTLYFAVENKPWCAWISLTIAILVKFYPLIFAIPLLFFYFEREGAKKTLSYILSMISLGVLIYIPFFFIYGSSVFYGIDRTANIRVSRFSTLLWISLLFGERELFLFRILPYIQVGLIFAYVLSDYFFERKKENPLSIDKVLIKRASIASLLFLLTFKLGGNQYVFYIFPFVLIFINCFKKLSYFIFWITALHIPTYLTIIIYGKSIKAFSNLYFLIGIVYLLLYMVAVVLIHSNKNLFENDIAILNERDFMAELYNFARRIKFFILNKELTS
jgi:uncharacterized membrane protein